MVRHFPLSIGRLLRGVRAGVENATYNLPELASAPGSIAVGSRSFADGHAMPGRHTADGEKLSPPLEWRNVPAGTATVLLVIEDADSPTPAPFVHLIAWRSHAGDGGVEEGELNHARRGADAFRHGRNGLFGRGYTPPDPLPGHGLHRYLFQVYALDTELSFPSPPGRRALLRAIGGHVIAKGCLMGTYERT